MKRTYELGKIDYLGNGRKTCMVDLEVSYGEIESNPHFSVCGDVWNNLHTDCYMCGQCVDEIAEMPEFKDNELVKELYRLWKLYHLKNMKSIPEDEQKKILELLK